MQPMKMSKMPKAIAPHVSLVPQITHIQHTALSAPGGVDPRNAKSVRLFEEFNTAPQSM